MSSLPVDIHSYGNPGESRVRPLEEFLIEVGRHKSVKPPFEALVEMPGGLERARNIYAKARPRYHPITQATVDAILK